MTKKEALAELSRLARKIGIICQHDSRADRQLDTLRAAARKGEREHRAFGARLLGHAPKRALSIAQAVDYFTVRCIAHGIEHVSSPRAELAGMRDDYVVGALLVAGLDAKRLATRGRARPPQVLPRLTSNGHTTS